MTRPERFLASQYEGIAPGYYDQVYRRGRGVQWFWHEHRFREVDRLLPAAAARILDLGCGPGTFLGRLDRPTTTRLGIDLAAPQIEYARAHYAREGLEFRVGDVRELAATEERFDAVVSIELVEHLPRESVRPLLRAIRDLLVPGGALVMTTPNYRSLWPLLERAVSLRGPVDYTIQHINPYTPARLAKELAGAGLVVESVQTFFVLAPFAAALGTRTAERILGWERVLLPRAGAELAIRARRAD